MKNKFILAALASVMALGMVGGCSQAAQEDMGKAGDKLSDAGEKVGEAGTNVGSAVAKDADKAGEVVDDAGVTAKVKTNLLTVDGLDAAKINVETADKTITLKGMAGNEELKKKAEESAKLAAPSDYKVDNQLTIG